ncbi:glucose-1-phosphate adenylyltransferase subunit GlgD [Salinicoccus jeotgali]|uniref:Glucose-1-phosphate adenylyltransferase subunit GlgD n=1 Tax=Salinicoccus jeotgali TaxID=381634 RepID=A0ABP7EFS5_9STAP
MDNEILGLINLQPEQDYLDELTYFRSSGSVPFMGRYRLIDFAITSMNNSGVNVIGVFAGNKFRSLLDHLNRKEDFGIEGRQSKIFVLPPDWNDPTDVSQGDLKHFHNHSDLFSRFKGNHVLVSGSQFISNTDYSEAVEQHIKNDRDVTFVSEKVETPPEGPILRLITEGDQVTGFTHDQENSHLYTGVYIIKKSVLMNIVTFCINNYKPSFFHNGIREKLEEYNTGFFDITAKTHYFHSIETYFNNSMALLEKDRYRKFFFGKNRVKTKVSTSPPTLYKKTSNVKKSILANGVTVEGTVERSIIGRNVKIGKGAVIKNSIIFANCRIEPDVHLENVILDKDVRITEGRQLMGSEEKPYVLAKRTEI